MDNSPRFSEVSVVSSFAYSDELNFAPSTKLRNSQPSLPNQEVPTRPATKRAQPSLSRSTSLQVTEPSRGAGWQRSLRSTKSINDASSRRLDGTVSRLLSTRGTDLSSSISSSLSIPDSSVSKNTRASTTPSTRAIQERSALKSSRLAELAHLQEQLEIKSRLLSAMEQQVLNAVQQIEDLQKEQELVKCEKQLLQDECAELRTENAGLNGQMKHLKESRLKLHRRCQEAEEGMSQLKKQLDDMKANSDVACVSADICKAALAQSLSEALAIHFRMLEAQSLLQNCQSELEMHRRHVRQLSDMLEQMHCQLSGALDQLEQATNSERQLKQQLATLQQEVNQALHRLADSQQHHAALQSREVELLEQLEQLVQERLLSVSNQPEQQPVEMTPVTLADKACSTEDCSPPGICQDGETQEGRTDIAQASLTIPCALDPVVQSRLQDWLKAAVQQGEVAAQLLESAESSPLAGMNAETHFSSAPPPMLLHWADPKRNQGEAAESPIGVYRRRPPLANIKGLALEKLLQDPSPRPHHYALLPYSAGSDSRIFDLSTRSSCSLVDVNGDSQPSARSILEAISSEELGARERAEQSQQASGCMDAAGCQQVCLAPGTIIEWSGPDGVMYRMKLEQLLLSLLDLQQRCRVAMSAAPLQQLGETNSEHASSSGLSQDHGIEHQGTPAQLQTIPSSASESHLLVLDSTCSESICLLDSDAHLQEGDASLPAAVIASFMDAQFSSDLDQKSWSDSVSSLEATGEDTPRHGPSSSHQIQEAVVDLHSQLEQSSQLFNITDVPEGSCQQVFDAFDAACTLEPATLSASTPSISALGSSIVPASTLNLPTESTSLPNLPTFPASNPDPLTVPISARGSSLAPLRAPNSSTASASATDSATDSIPPPSAQVMSASSTASTSSATSTTEDSTALLLEAQRQLRSVAGQLRCRIAASAERLVVAEREADLQLKLREAGTLMSRVANSGCWPAGAQTAGTRPSSSDGSQIDGSRDGLDKIAGSSCASSPRPVGHGKRRWVVADPEPLPTSGMDYLSEVFLPENDLIPFQDQLFSISCKPGTSDVTAVALATGTDGKVLAWTGAQTTTTSTASISQLEEFQQEAEKLQNQYNEAVAVVLQHWNCSVEVALYLRGVEQESVAGESSVDDDAPQLPASVRNLVEARSKVDSCQAQVEECQQLLQETLRRLENEEQLRCEAALHIEAKHQEHSQEVKQLQQLLEERGEKLLQITEHLEERDGKLGQFAEHLEERDGRLAQLAECLEERDGKLAQLAECLEARDGKLAQLAEHLEEREGKLVQLAEELEERDGKLVQLAEHLEERDEKLSQLAEHLEVQLKERDEKLTVLSQQMDSQLTERDLKLAELAEESQRQSASAQQQLLEREAQLLQARAKFEELELQLLLHSCSAGQLPGSYGPLDHYAQRSRRFVLSTSLLEQNSTSNPLQQFAMCSAATFIQHHKLNLAMTRTASSHQDSFCCPRAAAAALCFTYNVTPASLSPPSTGSQSSACKCCSSCKSGVRKTSKGRFRLGRRLIFIGMPGAALMMACVWVAELFHPGLADKRRVLRSKLTWHRQK